MKCLYCGTDNPSNNKFCLKCGKKLTIESSPEAPLPNTEGFANNPFSGMDSRANGQYNDPFNTNKQPASSFSEFMHKLIHPADPGPYDKNDTICLIGFILSLLSILFRLIGIPALVLSIIGVLRVNNTGQKGKKLAIAGIVISALMVYALFFGISNR